VQPPPQLPIRIASAPRWRPARRRISRAPSYRGRHMANPGTTNAPVGGGAFASVRQQYGVTASCSPIQMDVKPVGADSRYWRSIPIAHHRNAGTYDRLCSPLQSCSSSGSRYHRNLHQDEFGPTRAERMQALAGGTAPSPIIGIEQIPCKFPAIRSSRRRWTGAATATPTRRGK